MRLFTVAVVLLICVVGLISVRPTYMRNQQLKKRDAELQDEIDRKKAEIARLCDYQRRFRDDSEFVETIARQNRRVFPGEIIFIFEGK